VLMLAQYGVSIMTCNVHRYYAHYIPNTGEIVCKGTQHLSERVQLEYNDDIWHPSVFILFDSFSES
jgi:hypothetical protein